MGKVGTPGAPPVVDVVAVVVAVVAAVGVTTGVNELDMVAAAKGGVRVEEASARTLDKTCGSTCPAMF